MGLSGLCSYSVARLNNRGFSIRCYSKIIVITCTPKKGNWRKFFSLLLITTYWLRPFHNSPFQCPPSALLPACNWQVSTLKRLVISTYVTNKHTHTFHFQNTQKLCLRLVPATLPHWGFPLARMHCFSFGWKGSQFLVFLLSHVVFLVATQFSCFILYFSFPGWRAGVEQGGTGKGKVFYSALKIGFHSLLKIDIVSVVCNSRLQPNLVESISRFKFQDCVNGFSRSENIYITVERLRLDLEPNCITWQSSDWLSSVPT